MTDMQKLQQESAVQTGTGFIARTVGVQVSHMVNRAGAQTSGMLCWTVVGNSVVPMHSSMCIPLPDSCAYSRWSWRQCISR